MKALVKRNREVGLWLEYVPEPEIGINDVLIKVDRTGICGTDVHIYKWDAWAQTAGGCRLFFAVVRSTSRENTMQVLEKAAIQVADAGNRPRSPDSDFASQDANKTTTSAPGLRRINLRVQLQTMATLMDVLTTVSRVGAEIESVVAANRQLYLVVAAREPIALKLPRLIDQLITVIAVSELTVRDSEI